jgi:hypothetical protein
MVKVKNVANAYFFGCSKRVFSEARTWPEKAHDCEVAFCHFCRHYAPAFLHEKYNPNRGFGGRAGLQ